MSYKIKHWSDSVKHCTKPVPQPHQGRVVELDLSLLHMGCTLLGYDHKTNAENWCSKGLW